MGVSSNKNMVRKKVSENIDSLKINWLTEVSVLQKYVLGEKHKKAPTL